MGYVQDVTGRVRRITFTVPVTTSLTEDEVQDLLNRYGTGLTRTLEGLLFSMTQLTPLRFKGGPTIPPFVGRKELTDGV